jgi:hypothetical protein
MTAMFAKIKAQSFQSAVSCYSAKEIAASIGCSLPTAYDWRSGRRSPPKWLHKRYLDELQKNLKRIPDG